MNCNWHSYESITHSTTDFLNDFLPFYHCYRLKYYANLAYHIYPSFVVLLSCNLFHIYSSFSVLTVMHANLLAFVFNFAIALVIKYLY